MPEKAGHRFGKYLLLDRIAAGGMAEIFRAKYLAAAGVTKSVVIKRILPHYAGNRAFVSMFVNEAKIAVGLSHGNIAQVFDFGEIDGEYYIAMELVHGQPLSRLIRRAGELGMRIPMPLAIYVAAEVCSGLHYAHSRTDDRGNLLGIVHRDVSPQNVIISYEGQVKIIDFGIAKARSAGDKTQVGAMKGKYVYFSPEQAKARPLDGRSDVYATGIMLYEMLTGRRPFEGKVIEVLGRIAKGEFIPPSAVNPDVPRTLEAIVMKAMATELEDRYADAQQMHDALMHFLHAADPRFSPSALGHLVSWLYRDEIAKEGLKPALPADFEQELERWKGPALLSGDERPGRVVLGVRRITSRTPTAETELPGDFARRIWRENKKRILVGGALASLLAVGALAFSFIFTGGPGTYELEVSSDPPGAMVSVDGRPTGMITPVTVAGLSTHQPHEVELTLAGHRPHRTTLPPQESERVAIEAPLEVAESPLTPPAESRAAADDHRDPPDDPIPAGPQARGPEATIELDGRQHAISIPSAAAARMRLDPKKTYQLTVEGQASLGGLAGAGRQVRSVFYFAERVRGTPAEGSFGELMPGTLSLVSGARAIYCFIVDETPDDNQGALRVQVGEVKAKKASVLLVDPARNAIPAGPRLARITGLSADVTYRVQLEGWVDLGAGGGTLTRVLYHAAGETPAPAGEGVISVDTPVELRGITDLWLLLPDDDPTDNDGTLKVTLAGPSSQASR